jgi:hypothetical protein
MDDYPKGRRMEYLFVDYENIAPKTVSGLQPNQTVLIFAGEKQTKMDSELVQSIIDRETKSRLIRINGDGKNAVDFHIAFYLGKLSDSDRAASFTILSKDKGFDPLVKHLVESGITCKRIGKLPAVTPPEVDSQPKLKAFVAHLNDTDEKTWPKKISTSSKAKR